MKVRATQLGVFGGKRRREGEIFDVPETVQVVVDAATGETAERPFKLGRWMESVDADETEPVATEPPHGGAEGRPVTVSLKGRVGKPAKIKVDPSGEPKADA